MCTGRAGGCNGCLRRPGTPQRRWNSKKQDLVSDRKKNIKVVITDKFRLFGLVNLSLPFLLTIDSSLSSAPLVTVAKPVRLSVLAQSC